MLKQDIIKLFITKNGINKNIIDEITKCNIENLEIFFNYSNLIEKEIIEIEDETERQIALNNFYDNQNTLFKIGILYRIKNIAKKNGTSVKEALLYQKTTLVFDNIKKNVLKFTLLGISIKSIFLYFKSIYDIISLQFYDFKLLLLFIIILIMLSILIATICIIPKEFNKKINKNDEVFHILCQIENEILD